MMAQEKSATRASDVIRDPAGPGRASRWFRACGLAPVLLVTALLATLGLSAPAQAQTACFWSLAWEGGGMTESGGNVTLPVEEDNILLTLLDGSGSYLQVTNITSSNPGVVSVTPFGSDAADADPLASGMTTLIASTNSTACDTFTLNVTVEVTEAPTAQDTTTTVAANSTNNPVNLDISGYEIDSVAVAAQPANGTATASGTAITYTPDAGFSGTDSFTYTATNAAGTSAPATATIDVAAPEYVLAPGTLPNGTVGEHYLQGVWVQTADGDPAISGWIFEIISGSLPPGMEIAYNHIVPHVAFQSTPTEAGTFDFTLRAHHPDFNITIEQPYTLTIEDDGTHTVTWSSDGPGTVVEVIEGDDPMNSISSPAEVTDGNTVIFQISEHDGATLQAPPSGCGIFSASDTGTAWNTAPIAADCDVSFSFEEITIAPASLPAATAGESYNQAITASGGYQGFHYFVEAGTLPNGMTLSEDGTLSGTPDTAGSYDFTVLATNEFGMAIYPQGRRHFQEIDYTLTVEEASSPVVTWDEGGNFDVYAYVEGDKIQNGDSVVADSIVAFNIHPRGRSTYSTAPSGCNISHETHDSWVGTVTETCHVSIEVEPIELSALSMTEASLGEPYDAAITATGGHANFTYSLLGGVLPEGMTLDPDGTLSGTPTETGSFDFTVKATNTYDHENTRNYTLTVADTSHTVTFSATSSTGIGVNALATANGTQLASGDTVSDGTTVEFRWEAGTADVTLHGITNTCGAVHQGREVWTATITGDCEIEFTVDEIRIDPPVLTTFTGTVGEPFRQQFTATGMGEVAWSSDPLPPGLNLDQQTGVVSGTPETAEVSQDIIIGADNVTHGGGVALPYIFLIEPAPTLTLTPDSLPDGTVYADYTAGFTAEGGTGPYSYAVIQGSLPEGLALTADGTMSGAPTEAGAFPITVTATDANDVTGTRDYTLTIAAPRITLGPEALPQGTAGAAYSQVTFTADGGVGAYDYEISDGALPQGMSLVGDTLSGTPSEAGEFTFTVTATDENGFTGTRDYRLTIEAPGITLDPETLPKGEAGTGYDPVNVSAEGGVAPYSFAISGDLPDGMTFEDGTLSGTPVEAGQFEIKITAQDKNGFTGARDYTLVIEAPDIALAPDTLPGGRVNSAYEAALSAEGGTAPYDFAVTNGDLPEGLTLAEDGALSGTPVEPGNFPITVTATDKYGFAGTRDYRIAIEDITLPEPKDHELTVMAGTSGTVDLTRGATGGPFTGAAIAARPAGEAGDARIAQTDGTYMLHFDASGTYAGTTSLSYTLSNADGVSEPAIVRITVVARPDPSQDPEVIGLVRAQTETARRFARTQIRNFSQRLEQLHNEGARRQNSIAVNLSTRSAYGASDSLALRGFESLGSQYDDLAFWSGGYVNFGTNDDGAIDLDHTLVGISAGADYRFSPRFTAGLGFGYGRDVTDIGENGTESRAKAYSLAAYGSYRPKPGFFIDGLAGYSSLDFDSKRYVTWTGDMATGTRGGEQVFAALTAGYEHRENGTLVSPYGRLSGSRSTLDMFTEEGGGIYNLTYDEQTVETLAATLGLRFEHSRPTSWGVLTSRARVEYTHDFEQSSRARLGYADLGTLPYVIDADGFSRDNLSLDLGVEAQVGEQWTLGVDYRTAFGIDGDSQDHTFGVKVDVRF